MMKNKTLLISATALMAVAPLAALTSTTQAASTDADTAITKTIMHTSIGYDKNGKSTGNKYYAYRTVNVMTTPVKINGDFYYRIYGSNQYIKATNIDGVTRKITHNTYIYRSSNGRTSYNGRWKLYAGQTVTTYGGSYKFRNGKHFSE